MYLCILIMIHFDTIILGAGASGLIAATESARKGSKVLVIDHAKEVGKKLLISGGGKCNVTNRKISWKDYFGENPEFCKNALQKYRIENVLDILQKAEIEIEEREYGRVFCRQGAKQLVNYLAKTANVSGASFLLETTITEVTKIENAFIVKTSKGDYVADNLLVATGGLACPQIGATDIGHKIAKQFGHKIIPAKPALVGFVLKNDSALRDLQGISFMVKASVANKMEVTEPLLFTHKGLSGPAIFQLSCCWEKDEYITLDFLPSENSIELMNLPENGKLQVKTLFSRFLPNRLLQSILSEDLASKKIAILSKKDRLEIAQKIHSFSEQPSGTEGFLKAETTKGGVDTSQISPKTMESLLIPKLFFAGEVLDIAGKLGGYNIHWAFASGYVAGRNFVQLEDVSK